MPAARDLPLAMFAGSLALAGLGLALLIRRDALRARTVAEIRALEREAHVRRGQTSSATLAEARGFLANCERSTLELDSSPARSAPQQAPGIAGAAR